MCLVVDASLPDPSRAGQALANPEALPVIVAVNKSDLCITRIPEVMAEVQSCNWGRVCQVSALTGSGLDHLRRAFADVLGRTESLAGLHLTVNARQRDCLASAGGAILRATRLAADASETIDCAELLALELREALNHLGAVTGDVTTDDILGRVFSSFCIGK